MRVIAQEFCVCDEGWVTVDEKSEGSALDAFAVGATLVSSAASFANSATRTARVECALAAGVTVATDASVDVKPFVRGGKDKHEQYAKSQDMVRTSAAFDGRGFDIVVWRAATEVAEGRAAEGKEYSIASMHMVSKMSARDVKVSKRAAALVRAEHASLQNQEFIADLALLARATRATLAWAAAIRASPAGRIASQMRADISKHSRAFSKRRICSHANPQDV